MKLNLDYTIKDINIRKNIVDEVCEKYHESLTPQNLESLSNYMLTALDKKERKEKRILTDNRMSTVNKRETSMEGLSAKFETSEDGLYQLVREDKNMLLSPAVSITKKDIEEIPFLAQIRDSIEKLKKVTPRNYIVQQAIIDLSQSQYIVKNAYRKTVNLNAFPRLTFKEVTWGEWVDFKDPTHVAALLKNYSKVKSELDGKTQTDLYWIMWDFEEIIDEYVKKQYPILFHIIVEKIDGRTNEDINISLLEEFGISYSNEYLSTVFNHKIPKVIALAAQTKELEWWFTFKTKGKWKRCSRCGEIKLASNLFFSKNKGSADGFYSICKSCRSTAYQNTTKKGR